MSPQATSVANELVEYVSAVLQPFFDEEAAVVWYDREGVLEDVLRVAADRFGWFMVPAPGAKNPLAGRVAVEEQLQADGCQWRAERKWLVYLTAPRQEPSWYEDLELAGRTVQKTFAEDQHRPAVSGRAARYPGPANTLVLSAEDAVPRLKRLGADTRRVFVWQRGRDDEAWPWRFPADAGRLDEAVGRSSALLVVIDPIMAFLDDSVLSSSDLSLDGRYRACWNRPTSITCGRVVPKNRTEPDDDGHKLSRCRRVANARRLRRLLPGRVSGPESVPRSGRGGGFRRSLRCRGLPDRHGRRPAGPLRKR